MATLGFISYSHADEDALERLRKDLAMLTPDAFLARSLAEVHSRAVDGSVQSLAPRGASASAGRRRARGGDMVAIRGVFLATRVLLGFEIIGAPEDIYSTPRFRLAPLTRCTPCSSWGNFWGEEGDAYPVSAYNCNMISKSLAHRTG